MAKYELKPPQIDAVQWTGDNLAEVNELFPDATEGDDALMVPNGFGGTMMVPFGNYVTKDQWGNPGYQPAESFEAQYEPAP